MTCSPNMLPHGLLHPKCYHTRSWQVIYNHPYCIPITGLPEDRAARLVGTTGTWGGSLAKEERDSGSGDQNPQAMTAPSESPSL